MPKRPKVVYAEEIFLCTMSDGTRTPVKVKTKTTWGGKSKYNVAEVEEFKRKHGIGKFAA